MALLNVVDTVNSGEWNLPSVKDLLKAVDSPRVPSPPKSASVETWCEGCFAKGRKFSLSSDKPCPHCTADRMSSTQNPASHSNSTYQDGSLGYDQSHHHADPGYFSRRSSIADYPFSTEVHHALKPEPFTHSPPYVFSTPSSSLSILPSSMTPRHYPRSGYTASRPRLNAFASSTLTPAKIASNDRHKLSEKHRRDGMGAFVQAGDVLRKGINPGLLSRCPVCLADAAQDSPHLSPTASPPTYPSIPNSIAGSGNARPKKPKNDMLEESLMWEFSWLLHMVPGEVARHLEGIREVAGQMARDKEYGMRNDLTKRKKWAADVRSEVLEQALRFMEGESERHSVDPWIREDESRGKKRRAGEIDGGLPAPALTPPSSRSSPTLGREGSEDGENEIRRIP